MSTQKVDSFFVNDAVNMFNKYVINDVAKNI